MIQSIERMSILQKRDRLFALVLIAATFLAYLPAWKGLPIWDDGDHITHLQLRSWHGLIRIWTEPGAAPQYYPVLHSIFWLEQKLWGEFPLGYHLVNISLHVASALLLVKILRLLGLPGAWLAAAIFALHPLHVESVAWISELKNTLSGTFCLLSALAYFQFTQDRHRRSYIFALVWFSLGLMTKSVIAPLPAALAVTLWWKQGTLSWRRDAKPLVPFFVIGITSGLFTAWVERKYCNAEGKIFDLSLIERGLIAGRAFWFYLAKLFWPADLIVIYPRWHIDPTIWWQYLFPIAALSLVATLSILHKRSRAPLAALLIFAAMIFPMLGFLNISYFRFSFVADHFLYLASIPIIALAAAGAANGPKRITLAAILVCLVFLTWRHSHVFRDGETFYRSVLTKNANSPTAHSNLGGVLVEQGRVDEAIAHYESALALEPDFEFAHFNLAAALLQKGLIDDATTHLQRAIEINPNYAKAYYSLGNIAAQKGDPDFAAACYQNALTLNPEFIEAHGNLGNILLQRGDVDLATRHYEKVIELDPANATAHYNLATVDLRQQRWDDAIAQLQTALRIDPNYPDAKDALEKALAARGQR